MSGNNLSLEEFKGSGRLFPLPNLVMFPHVVQPLRIFEPRYVEMLEDAMTDDRLIATALLLPGWENDYDGRPPVAPIVCLGRVMSCSPTKDGQYAILLAGISRALVLDELPAKHSYRLANLKLLQDREADEDDPELAALHSELAQRFRHLIPENVPVQNQLHDLLNQQTLLGTLTDVISYSLPDLSLRQVLLSEVDVIQRTKLLLDHLDRSDQQPFPPEFSLN